MKWIKTTIGEHCTVTSSKRFHLAERSDEGIPFYCSKEIIQKVKGQKIIECDYIREELYENVKRQFGVPQTGDLLITTRGTYGVPYIYTDTDCFYFADGNLTWLKDFDTALLPQYLYYWVLSYEGQKKIDAIAKGTAQKAVPIAAVKLLELHLPSIKTQHQIVDILSAYDNLIKNNRKQIKLLEEVAQRLYKEWFVDLRFPGYEDVAVIDNVPNGWDIRKIDDVFSFKYGKTLPTSKITDTGKYPVYGANGTIGYYHQKNCDNYVVLITSRGNGSGDISRTYDKESFVTNNSFIVKPIDESFGMPYTYQLMKSTDFKNICTGSAQPQLTNNSISMLSILVPQNLVISDFCARTQPLYDKIERLLNQNHILAKARDRLLPKLMSGELEV